MLFRSTEISMNMTDIKNSKKYSLIETSDEQNNLKTLKTTLTEKKESSPIEIMQKEDDIERQKSNNKKDDLIMERITHIEDKGMIRKCIVKEMLEKIERQNDNTLKLVNIETLRKKLDIERDIERERHMTRKGIEKERHNSDSLEKVFNKEEKNDSSKKSNSLKEEIDKKLKSIKRFMTDTQDNSLAELIKKIEILNSPLEKKEIERDIAILDITETSNNDKNDRRIRNTIFHKCKEYEHTKK